ncbi:MAG: hypothetical protein FWH27_07615 [Planctomycetaceae bacterium]|nr:hypothetical protein [Planctomycetaceae bacterium]
MGLFKKKPKARKSIIDAAHDLKHEVEGEALPTEVGMDPDEIERLLELLGRDNANRTVFRRRVDSILDVAKGRVLWLRPYRLTVEEAKALIRKIAERQREREMRLLKKRRRKNPDYQLPKYLTPENIEYPSNLSPDDVLAAGNAARHRLEEPPSHNETETAEERRSRRVFEALEQLKNEEATRFARRVAMIQRHHIEGKPPMEDEAAQEGSDMSDVWAAHGIDDEELERIRTLQGFGKKPLKTLIDEAGEVVDTNIDAATKVVQQWIGNQKSE